MFTLMFMVKVKRSTGIIRPLLFPAWQLKSQQRYPL